MGSGRSKFCCILDQDIIQEPCRKAEERKLDPSKVSQLWSELRAESRKPDTVFIQGLLEIKDFDEESILEKDDPRTEWSCKRFAAMAAKNGDFFPSWNDAYVFLGGNEQGLSFVQIYSMRFHSTIFKHSSFQYESFFSPLGSKKFPQFVPF